jgi:hypothetical protein
MASEVFILWDNSPINALDLEKPSEATTSICDACCSINMSVNSLSVIAVRPDLLFFFPLVVSFFVSSCLSFWNEELVVEGEGAEGEEEEGEWVVSESIAFSTIEVELSIETSEELGFEGEGDDE